MTRISSLLKIQPDIVVNVDNIAYIELTGKGGVDIHFVGRIKAVQPKRDRRVAAQLYLGRGGNRSQYGGLKPKCIER